MARYLLVGLPRSGTSWVGRALTCAPGVSYLDEPDGFRDAFPFRVMMRWGETPIIGPDDPAPDYDEMWRGILAGGLRPTSPTARLAQRAFDRAGTEARRRARAGAGTTPGLRLAAWCARPSRPDPAARDVFVTSVQCMGALEHVAVQFEVRVIVLFRSLLNTIASWHELEYGRNPRELEAVTRYCRDRWSVPPPDAVASLLARRAFVVAGQTAMLRDAAGRHPEWTVAVHDELCVDAVPRLRSLAESVGLAWTDASEEFVTASNRADAEPWSTNRVSKLLPERWRERLSADDVAEIRSVVDAFPSEAGLSV